jgi:tetratricopeptide (TPR) repeat protein
MEFKMNGYRYLFLLIFIFLIGCGEKVPKRILTQTEIQSLYTYKNLGLAHLEEEQANKAIEAFQKVVDLAPDEPLGYANMALAHLRLRNTEESLLWIQKALQIAPENPDVRFIAAEIYEWEKEEEKSLNELEKVIQLDPDHLFARYKIVRHHSMKRKDPKSLTRIEKELKVIAEKVPENIAVLLELGQTLIDNNKIEETKEIYQKILTLSSDLNQETLQYLHKGIELIETGQLEKAKSNMMIFENVQRNSPRYQQGRKVISGHLLGIPITDFSEGISQYAPAGEEPIPVNFEEKTEEIGLEGFEGEGLAMGDLDGDSDLDLYLTRKGSNKLFLFDGKKFIDKTKESRTGDEGNGRRALVADYDNDKDFDLYTVNKGPNRLFQNDGKGIFKDVTQSLGVSDPGSSTQALFIDFDQEGDLDLFVTNEDSDNHLFENNVDSPFSEVASEVGIAGVMEKAVDCSFGDFDDDGDLDLLVLYRDKPVLYTNLRQDRFREIPVGAGLNPAPQIGWEACAVGDVNNDGALDILLTGKEHILYNNKGDESFIESRIMKQVTRDIGSGQDGLFFDLDNDGYLDILIVGEKGMVLLRNDRAGNFLDASLMLPGEEFRNMPLKACASADYDQDGDLDIFLLGDKIHILQNKGGNQNHWLDVKLVGLGIGAGKNNIQGLGARLEVKAGNLYQLKNVRDPISHFGLGSFEEADVIRVVWTNGGSQNRVKPGVDVVFTEEQILKGSCPFLYAWNGEEFQFVTDLLWRSMLGMIAGNQTVGFHEAAEEYIKVPGSFLSQRDGEYLLRITQELWEIPYIDEVKLMVVDSPPEVLEIHVDERFLPPPFPPFKIYPVMNKIYPSKAFDEKGRNLLPFLLARDGKNVSGFEKTRYQGISKLHDLILDFNPASSIKHQASSSVRLFLYGWLLPTDTSINIAIGKTRSFKPILPNLQVPDKNGEWVTVINPLWFPAGRNKMMVVDLTGKFLSDDFRVKISTTMEIHWDEAFITVDESSIQPALSGIEGNPASRIQISTLFPQKAELQYHGFSQVVQSDGYADTPGWPFSVPVYDDITEFPLWRDAEGFYTRYGDVTPLLQQSDNQYVIMKTGDEIALSYPADKVPELPEGWKRDYLLFSNGWLKDTEINAIAGATVGPLPFHEMTGYPYEPPDDLPTDREHQNYMKEYNTRKVTQIPFRELIKTYPTSSM